MQLKVYLLLCNFQVLWFFDCTLQLFCILWKDARIRTLQEESRRITSNVTTKAVSRSSDMVNSMHQEVDFQSRGDAQQPELPSSNQPVTLYGNQPESIGNRWVHLNFYLPGIWNIYISLVLNFRLLCLRSRLSTNDTVSSVKQAITLAQVYFKNFVFFITSSTVSELLFWKFFRLQYLQLNTRSIIIPWMRGKRVNFHLDGRYHSFMHFYCWLAVGMWIVCMIICGVFMIMHPSVLKCRFIWIN